MCMAVHHVPDNPATSLPFTSEGRRESALSVKYSIMVLRLLERMNRTVEVQPCTSIILWALARTRGFDNLFGS
jgi:hypothetical protein